MRSRLARAACVAPLALAFVVSSLGAGAFSGAGLWFEAFICWVLALLSYGIARHLSR